MRKFLSAAVMAGFLAGAADAATLYQNGFDNGLGGVVTTGTILTSSTGITYLGNLTQGATAAFTLDTSGYTNLRLAFTLYGVNSLDGLGPAGGNSPGNPDAFLVADASGTIFNYSFANYSGDTQSYGGAGVPAGSYAAYTGSASCGDLGQGCGAFGDATYLLSNLALTPAPGGLLTVTFTGNSNQDASDEYFGIDNLLVTGDAIVTAPGMVPEPATWTTMIAGFGLIGAGLRRRRPGLRLA